MGALLNRRRVGAAGAALLVALTVILLLPSIEKAIGASPDPDPVCATSEPHFYTTDVPGTNFFGPAAGGTLEEILAELHTRRCQDPALVVGHAYDAGLEGFAQLSGDAAFTAKIVELIDNRDLWRQTVAILEDVESNASAEVITMEGSYQTLYMVPTYGVPVIRQAVVDRPTFAVLKFTLADGSTRIYKLDCGFQPVRQGEFPGVPQLPPPTTSVCTTDCGPPPCSPKDCPPPPGKCANQTGPYCGTPDGGPEYLPPTQGPSNPNVDVSPRPPPSNPPPSGAPAQQPGGGGVVFNPPSQPATPPTTSPPVGDPGGF